MDLKTETNYINSFTNYLLRTFNVPGSILGSEAICLPTLVILFHKTFKSLYVKGLSLKFGAL